MVAKVVITGASGNLGRGVTELLQGTYEVTLTERAALPSELNTRRPEKLKTVLGYAPKYNFATFVQELRERDRSGDLSAPAGYSAHGG